MQCDIQKLTCSVTFMGQVGDIAKAKVTFRELLRKQTITPQHKIPQNVPSHT